MLRYDARRPTKYSGTTASIPAHTREATRNGIGETAITSRASISSEILIAPSCAVNPQPTVAESATPATSGEISRVLK